MIKRANDAVTWMSINNWVPIIISFIGLSLTYGALLTRISILETKVDAIIAYEQKASAKLDAFNVDQSKQDLKLQALEDDHRIFKVKLGF